MHQFLIIAPLHCCFFLIMTQKHAGIQIKQIYVLYYMNIYFVKISIFHMYFLYNKKLLRHKLLSISIHKYTICIFIINDVIIKSY
jgi:hypothetical protein